MVKPSNTKVISFITNDVIIKLLKGLIINKMIRIIEEIKHMHAILVEFISKERLFIYNFILLNFQIRYNYNFNGYKVYIQYNPNKGNILS
jgi:hypothetical protein